MHDGSHSNLRSRGPKRGSGITRVPGQQSKVLALMEIIH